jgi:acetyl-CoA C-acetyltransferase
MKGSSVNDVLILSASRTPIGSFLGALSSLTAPQLGGFALASALAQSQVTGEEVDHVIMGQVLQAGVGQAPARQAVLQAGLPPSVGAVTVHKVCGSGVRAVMDASNALRAQEHNVVLAGGMESMSNAPHLLERSRTGFRMGHVPLSDSMIKDGLWDPYGNKHMGSCAETCAKKYGFSREAQDAFALHSYEKAQKSIQEGLFKKEVVAVQVPSKKEGAVSVTQDEEPFAAPLHKISSLKPAFDPQHGTITAGNASKINDGAAALVLASSAWVAHTHRTPLARVVSYASHAQDPEWFTTAPIEAARKALRKAGLAAHQIHRWEINEAFAIVTMAAIQELELNPHTVNVRGGAVALGHPIGASGARILTTLVHTLIQDKAQYGCVSICIGGGEACALVVENLCL